MAELPIPKMVKKLWDVWNLRGGILLSLILQLFLMVFASYRQRCRSSLLLIFIWLAYLLADWVATVCLGLITKTQGMSCDEKGNDDVLAFWASFLLIHLGGPDTITSFALEDNEFWIRHLIGLVLQVLVAAYSFFLTLPENKLWIPTILVFMVGTIKFVERTFALYLASSDQFAETMLRKPESGPDYEEAVAIYSSMRSVEVTRPEKITMTPNVWDYPKEAAGVNGNKKALEKIIFLEKAYENFESFKGLIVGLLLGSKVRELSRKDFLNRSPNEAFRLIDYELNFMYQVLHTKVGVVRQKIGYILRLFSLFSIVCAFIFFYFVEKKQGFVQFDKVLTYALLIGAIFIDSISVFHLIFSEWTLIAPIKSRWKESIKESIAKIALKGERWSGTVSQYNILRYCLDERPVSCVYNLAGYLYIRGILERIKLWLYSSTKTVDDDLKILIFEELRTKSLTASTLSAAMEACSKRGEWALLQNSSFMELEWSVGEFQYAESIILWHTATELCYHGQETLRSEDEKSKKICKLLSDYMFCLLVTQRSMLAPVLGNWRIVFLDTCAEAQRFFDKYPISGHKEACKKIISIKTNFRPAAVKGSTSKSVLFDASILAKQLQNLDKNQWKLMSRVWVELLSYAAINCRPIVHAQQPSKGGELLTFTWLLMNHLGLGTQFYEQALQVGTKRVARK